MQFTLLTFVTLFAAALAAPLKGEDDSVAKRQGGGQPTTSQAAMTAQDGSVVAFNTANVYLDSVAKGL
ncbi:hypothetical protein KVR01_012450 [Diaporthe batatas]|uniref:uncharacterized protein n=1 Tax=Diaporthe batatas TaxID=748121 RepID=UPI001D045E79|nr:uncharacterized protein KVR01_012450 [Diaporthe batatas]KAG8157788.1 hypothetical protein KVR01_012450 [Diaporthe batatas]